LSRPAVCEQDEGRPEQALVTYATVLLVLGGLTCLVGYARGPCWFSAGATAACTGRVVMDVARQVRRLAVAEMRQT
jgi:hypothetical protein